jgi:uncharacterized protein (TIGR02996 family)
MRSILELAGAAIATGDTAAAIEHLLDAWRRTRAPRIADLLELVTTRIDPGEPLDDKTTADWLAVARARRTEDLPRLLSSVDFGRVEGDARVLALTDWQDPRIGTALTKILVRDAGAPVTPFTRTAIDLVSRLSRAPQALSAEDEASCRRIELELEKPHARGSARSPIEERLLLAIAEMPDDDERRLVYGDWLTERDDLRGELIHVQILRARGKSTAEKLQREKELLASHQAEWLGPLSPIVRSARYERGFPTAVELRPSRALGPVIGHVGWATVEELQANDVDGSWHLTPLIGHPVFRALRRLSGIELRALVELTRDQTRPYDSITRIGDAYDQVHTHLVDVVERLPQLATIGLYTDRASGFQSLFESPVARRIRCFEAHGNVMGDDFSDGIEVWFATVERSAAAQFDFVVSHFMNDELTLSFTRDSANRLSILRVRCMESPSWSMRQLRHLLLVLEYLPADAITQLFVDGAIASSVPDYEARATRENLQRRLVRFPRLDKAELPTI